MEVNEADHFIKESRDIRNLDEDLEAAEVVPIVDAGNNRVIQHSPLEFAESIGSVTRGSPALDGFSAHQFNYDSFGVNYGSSFGGEVYDASYNVASDDDMPLVNACCGEGVGKNEEVYGRGCCRQQQHTGGSPFSTKSGSILLVNNDGQSLVNVSDKDGNGMPQDVMSMSTSSSCIMLEPTEEERFLLFNLPPVAPQFMVSKLNLSSQIDLANNDKPYPVDGPVSNGENGNIPCELDVVKSKDSKVAAWLLENVDQVVMKSVAIVLFQSFLP